MNKKTCDFRSSDRTPPGVGGSFPGFIHLRENFDFLIHLSENEYLRENRVFWGTETWFYIGNHSFWGSQKAKKFRPPPAAEKNRVFVGSEARFYKRNRSFEGIRHWNFPVTEGGEENHYFGSSKSSLLGGKDSEIYPKLNQFHLRQEPPFVSSDFFTRGGS